ncbi:MAG TPA: pyridoxal phosphate-dependent aminotransferase family protein [Bacteroidia bacterium]|jgi:8-amino-7-oxononanoate synthase|nr:pyridoxal phosphate-dependent aminotransferase family protein [Bacteroidia bacterium]
MPKIPLPAESRMNEALRQRREAGAFRILRQNHTLIDFCSNDYLGFVRSSLFKQKLDKHLRSYSSAGSTGSRLLSGNTIFAETLESQIARWHGEEAGLIFNSGYDANLGLFSCIASRGDTILYDALSHASIRDGIRLSKANAFAFRHNDVLHLEERLKESAKNGGQIFVAIESVYSMDGDFGLLDLISALCEKYGANLIVDEAHATGVCGKKGEGLVERRHSVFARVHTFGKALGCHGAIVLGGVVLRDWLINYARSFIYTTAIPSSSLAAIAASYELLEESAGEREKLNTLIHAFTKETKVFGIDRLLPSASPIQCMLVPGNEKVREKSGQLVKAGFDVRPILSPTVPEGTERLRICLHSFNTTEETRKLAQLLVSVA